MHAELGNISRPKDLLGLQERNLLHMETRNGAWLSDVPHCLNVTELSREKFRVNLRLRYGLMPKDIPATCNGCGKKFLIEYTLSFPKGGIFLLRHNDDAKEWGALGYRALFPSVIS